MIWDSGDGSFPNKIGEVLLPELDKQNTQLTEVQNGAVALTVLHYGRHRGFIAAGPVRAVPYRATAAIHPRFPPRFFESPTGRPGDCHRASEFFYPIIPSQWRCGPASRRGGPSSAPSADRCAVRRERPPLASPGLRR